MDTLIITLLFVVAFLLLIVIGLLAQPKKVDLSQMEEMEEVIKRAAQGVVLI